MRIQDMPWPEVKAALERTDLMIVPLAAVETYGPHLPTGLEIYVTEEIARRLGEAANGLVAPTLPVTYSIGNTGFPGTFYVSLATLAETLREMCLEMIEYGIRRIFFLNGHGPNIPAIEEVSREFGRDGVKCAQIDLWRAMIRLADGLFEGRDATGHGSELAASTLLAVRPDLVRTDKYVDGMPVQGLAQRYPDVMLHPYASDRNEYGHLGDPSRASKEKGEEIIRRTAERYTAFLNEWQ
ncbi:MAG: creatininase family protein [Chloroflexi bacterium]|nr:creatininase family protein [Chloroflexota bacterium]